MRGLYASPLGLLIGLSLGALGGGGSILAVPALVYGAGESAHAATSTSLLVVGIASLLGVGSHWREGNVRLTSGLIFGACGIGGSAIGTTLNGQVEPDVLLLAFSAVMVIAAVGMLRRCDAPPADKGSSPPVSSELPSTDVAGRAGSAVITAETATVPTRTFELTAAALPKVLLAGTVVGLMTGFFGVGGGFIIVPALILTLRFQMPEAVGTSLVVIAINSAVALALRSGASGIRWGDALPFIALAIVGTIIGKHLADRLDARKLTRSFVGLLLVVAAYTATSSVIALA